ncbi:MAG: DUF1987 domain-containing protein [Cyclobacteriaceae bacterium]
MKKLILSPTPKTPKVEFDPDSGKFELSGRSIPENSIELYNPVIQWMDEYVNAPHDLTKFEIKLEYFNTSSSKCIVEIFRRLERIHGENHKVQVKWYYESEDEDMMESGEDFKEIIKVPIELVPLEED